MDTVPAAPETNQARTLYGIGYGKWRDIARFLFPNRRAHQEIYLVLYSFARRSGIGLISAPTRLVLKRCGYDEATYRRVLGDLILCGLVYPHNMSWWMRPARERGCGDHQLVIMDPNHVEVTECAFLAFQWLLGAAAWCRLLRRVMGESTAIVKPTAPRGRMVEEEIIQVVIRLVLRRCKSMAPCDDKHGTVRCSTIAPKPVTDSGICNLQKSAFSLPLSTPKNKRVHQQVDVPLNGTASQDHVPGGPPTLEHIREYAKSRESKADVEHFHAIGESFGWRHGRKWMDWRQSFRAFEKQTLGKAPAMPNRNGDSPQ